MKQNCSFCIFKQLTVNYRISNYFKLHETQKKKRKGKEKRERGNRKDKCNRIKINVQFKKEDKRKRP